MLTCTEQDRLLPSSGSVGSEDRPRVRRAAVLVASGFIGLTLLISARRGAFTHDPAYSADTALAKDRESSASADDAVSNEDTATDNAHDTSRSAYIRDVSVVCGSRNMALGCNLTVEWDGELASDTTASVRYQPLDETSLPALWTSPKVLDSGASSVSFEVFRLRPLTRYEYSIFFGKQSASGSKPEMPSMRQDRDAADHVATDSRRGLLNVYSFSYSYDLVESKQGDDESLCGSALSVFDGTFVVGRTGVPAFDAAQGRMSTQVSEFGGGGLASWEVATMSYSTDHGSSKNDSWAGLVTVDAEGFIVWYAQMREHIHSEFMQVGPFDQVGGSHMAYGVWFTERGGFPSPDLDDNNYNGTLFGILIEVDEWGEIYHEMHMECTSPEDMNAVTMHELRAISSTSVLVSGFGMHPVGDFDVGSQHYEDMWIASGTLSLWNPENGTVSQVLDLWAPLNPKFTGEHSCFGCTSVVALCDYAEEHLNTIDYMHISSASPGLDDNYLVTLRNLNLVASLNATTGDVDWLLSSAIDLSSHYFQFAFAHDDDAFYYPHHVSQIASSDPLISRVLLMDNGIGRPDGKNFTRAVEYALNSSSGIAQIVWQFEYPMNMSAHTLALHNFKDIEKHDIQSAIGNSVSLLSNGHYVVGFTDLVDVSDDDNAASPVRMDTLIFDVNKKGGLHSAHRIQGDSVWGEGSYRVIPHSSTAGESATCPLLSL